MKPLARFTNRASLVGVLVALTAGMMGCSPSYPMDTLSNGSDFARRIHSIYVFVNWIDFVIMLIVLAVMFLAIFWFSTRVGEPGEPSTVTSDIRLEVAWTAIPALILVFITVPTIRTIWATQPDHWPADALTIKVIAHQWWWEFQYPQYGIDTADEVHLQAGRMVHFSMESADIIHSFWVPTLGGKRDVVPGQINSITYTPDQLGEFYGQCVEFCGDSHANMRLRALRPDQGRFRQVGQATAVAAGDADRRIGRGRRADFRQRALRDMSYGQGSLGLFHAIHRQLQGPRPDAFRLALDAGGQYFGQHAGEPGEVDSGSGQG